MFTRPATAQYIQQHLDEDMELMARMEPCPIEPAIPSSSPSAGPTGSTPVPAGAALWLQVLDVADTSLSLRERLQAVLPADVPLTSLSWDTDAREEPEDGLGDADEALLAEERDQSRVNGGGGDGGVALATLQASEAAEEARHRKRYGGSGPWRCLRFVLTDGFTRLIAVEDRRPAADGNVAGRGPPVFPSGVTLGSKIKVSLDAQGLPRRTNGILRIHRDNTTFVGGEVRALQVLAEMDARRRLEAMTGRPSKAQARSSSAIGNAAQETHRAPPPVAAPQPQPQPPRAAPQTLASLPNQSLEAWDAHVRDKPGQPFRTEAVITEVVSDMLLNEYPPAMRARLLPSTLDVVTQSAARSDAWGTPTPPPADTDTITLYSLLVQLSTPAAAAAVTQPDTPSTANLGPTLIVDLGHPWLLDLVGMPPRAFRALSEAAPLDAQQAARLQGIIERVGHVLETLGTATFVLQQRPLDDVVEVVSVEHRAA